MEPEDSNVLVDQLTVSTEFSEFELWEGYGQTSCGSPFLLQPYILNVTVKKV